MLIPTDTSILVAPDSPGSPSAASGSSAGGTLWGWAEAEADSPGSAMGHTWGLGEEMFESRL